MGFGMEGERCVVCKKELTGGTDIFLIVEKGGCACRQCAKSRDRETLLPAAVLALLAGCTIRTFPVHQPGLSALEERRITRLLASYCRYHCDTKAEMKALEFLDTLLFARPSVEDPIANMSF